MEHAEKQPKWEKITRFYHLFTGEWIDLEHILNISTIKEGFENRKTIYFDITFFCKETPIRFSVKLPDIIVYEGDLAAELNRMNHPNYSGNQGEILLPKSASWKEFREALYAREDRTISEFKANYAAFVEDVKKYKNTL